MEPPFTSELIFEKDLSLLFRPAVLSNTLGQPCEIDWHFTDVVISNGSELEFTISDFFDSFEVSQIKQELDGLQHVLVHLQASFRADLSYPFPNWLALRFFIRQSIEDRVSH